MLDRISGKTSCISIHNELPEEEKESSLEQEEEVLIAKSQPLQSQGLAINLKLSIRQNPPREEEIQPLEIPFEIKDDLFMLILGKASTFCNIRDLRVNIIQILSRKDLLESILISMYDIGKNSRMACQVMS